MSPIELGQAAEYLRNKWRSYLRYDIHNGASDRNYFSLNRARQLERARFRQADAVAKAADDLLHSLRTATRSLDQIAEVVFSRVNDVCYLIGRTVIILCLLHRVFAEWAAIVDEDGRVPAFWPHDFCRVFTTDAILNGMPPHIAQLILGHDAINTTMGYKKPRELHQAGEKPQVARSARCVAGLSGVYIKAI
jgi:hypothetical protein